MSLILQPGGHGVAKANLDRLPVLASLAEEQIGGTVTLPPGKCVHTVLEFQRIGNIADFVLHDDTEKANIQRSTLDYLGVDTSGMRTARQMREGMDTRQLSAEAKTAVVDPRTTRVDTRIWRGEVYQKWKTGMLKSADVARLMEDKLARDGYQHRYAATMLNSKNGVCCVVVCQRCSKGFTPNSWSGGRGNPPLQQRRHDSVCWR